MVVIPAEVVVVKWEEEIVVAAQEAEVVTVVAVLFLVHVENNFTLN